ncbi:hypothetical protein BDW22DRAFT_1330026 [Trametopsis cervina]|nr:hypothetical protein BDW22DRAFT_1330026 [Trametopsis cervina]
MRNTFCGAYAQAYLYVPFGVTYEKIGTIQRRLAWPLHKDDTLSRSGRPTGLNIYAHLNFGWLVLHFSELITPIIHLCNIHYGLYRTLSIIKTARLHLRVTSRCNGPKRGKRGATKLLRHPRFLFRRAMISNYNRRPY